MQLTQLSRGVAWMRSESLSNKPGAQLKYSSAVSKGLVAFYRNRVREVFLLATFYRLLI